MMKKNFTILALLLCYYSATAQINIVEASATEKEETKVEYDSLSNCIPTDYVFRHYRHLKGQKLMFCGKGYERDNLELFYTLDNIGNKMYMDGTTLIGEYFELTGIIENFGKDDIFELVRISDSQPLLYKTSKLGENQSWVVVGFYEKMKQLFVGKSYIYSDTECVISQGLHYRYDKMLYNMETNNPDKDIPNHSEWKCVDIGVKLEKRPASKSLVILIFENPDLGKRYTYIDDEQLRIDLDTASTLPLPHPKDRATNLPLHLHKFIDKEEYRTYLANKEKEEQEKTQQAAQRREAILKKYGKAKGELILVGKIQIGMTKQMCRDAWGEPKHINTTTTAYGASEQWVYGDSYVYFENGIITGIQN